MTQVETQPNTLSHDLAHVSETGLLTLFCRAKESQSAHPILIDPQAVKMAEALRPELAGSDREGLRRLAQGQIDPRLAVHIALRARKYDETARDFAARHPHGMIVNLGCGLDARFFRIDGRDLLFFDLDLPEVIQAKRRFLAETECYHMIGASVFDDTWLDQVESTGRTPALFMAEGLFMYLEPDQVRGLVIALRNRFPGSELMCEVTHRRWLSASTNWMVRRKLQGRMKIGAQAEFRFGVADGRELESWSPGIQLLEEWSYFDTNHPKLGALRWLGKFELFRKAQWTVHYRLGA